MRVLVLLLSSFGLPPRRAADPHFLSFTSNALLLLRGSLTSWSDVSSSSSSKKSIARDDDDEEEGEEGDNFAAVLPDRRELMAGMRWKIKRAMLSHLKRRMCSFSPTTSSSSIIKGLLNFRINNTGSCMRQRTVKYVQYLGNKMFCFSKRFYNNAGVTL